MRALFTAFICILLTACTGAMSSETEDLILGSEAALRTSTVTPIPSATPTLTPIPTSTTTPTPTLSPTPEGLIGLTNCYKLQDLKHIGAGTFTTLLYSPDGTWLAAATTGGVTLYDAGTMAQAWSATTARSLEQIAFSSDGATLVGVDSGLRIYLWQIADGKELASINLADLDAPPTTFALSLDGTGLAVPYYDDSIHIYQTSDGSLVNKIEQFLSLGEMIYRISYSPEGNRLVTISFNGDIRIWDVPGNKMVKVLNAESNRRPDSMFFTADGKTLAFNFVTQTGQSSIRMLDMNSFSWRQSLDGEMVAFSPVNSILSTASDGLALRNFSGGNRLQLLPETEIVQGQPSFNADGTLVAVGTQAGIHVWRWADASLVGTVPGQYIDFTQLAISPDGYFIATGVLGGIALYQTSDISMTKFFTTGDTSEAISSVAYSPFGGHLAGASGTQVYVWRVDGDGRLWSKDVGKSINRLAFSPDGSILVAAVSGESLTGLGGKGTSILPVWATNDGTLLVEMEIPDQILMPGTTDVVFTPDASNLISVQGSGDITVWQLTDFTLKYRIENKELIAWNQVLAISPDGQQFAAGGMDRIIRLFKLDQTTPETVIERLDDSVSALAFSPDGSLIAAGIGEDIRIWDTGSGSPHCNLTGSPGVVKSIIFTPNSRSLITLATDGIIRIWSIQ